MTKSFFMNCMPYVVELQKDSLVVYSGNRCMLFKCLKPKKLDVKRMFCEISVDCFHNEYSCYLYDKNKCPSGNKEGYSEREMGKYWERLKLLLKYLGDTELSIRMVYDTKDLKLNDTWGIIETMSESLSMEDSVISNLLYRLNSTEKKS